MRYLLYLFIILSNITSCISISDIPVYIALKQYNINFLENRLTDISNPLSNNYKPDEVKADYESWSP